MQNLGNDPQPEFVLGTAEHAARLTEGRHPGVVTAMAWLAFSHLPEHLRVYARPFYQTGAELVVSLPVDSAELTTTLNKLVEAKDWAVRAAIRFVQGKPGPAPRPAQVVDPPTFGSAQVPARPDQQLPGGNFGAGQPRPRPIRDEPQA